MALKVFLALFYLCNLEKAAYLPPDDIRKIHFRKDGTYKVFFIREKKPVQKVEIEAEVVSESEPKLVKRLLTPSGEDETFSRDDFTSEIRCGGKFCLLIIDAKVELIKNFNRKIA